MRRALIVDDSKTAQMRLKKMLERYDLEVDTALSGEDALAYLSYRTPVVIFMDHTMEGMDGFEALKIIKANPNTAMIPVIMYTAQKGDVYVGQARALGALDILSKEVIKPSNLERVLRALNIRPIENEVRNEETTQAAADGSGAPESTRHAQRRNKESPKEKQEGSDLDQIRSQIARLFEIHIADVRTQITENTKFIVRRLSRDLDQRQQDVQVQPQNGSADVPEAVVEREVAAERTRLGLVSNSLLLLILLGLASLAWMLFDTRELVGQQSNSPNVAAPSADERSEVSELNADIETLRDVLAEERRQKGRLMNAITWAMENDFRFAFGEAPLSEPQVNKLYSLVYMLDHAGYSGTMMLEIHLGNFCLVQDTAGNWVPAPPATPVTSCTQAADLDLGLEESEYLSLEYLNFEQTAAPVVEGKIQVDVNMMGTGLPRYPYPPATSQITAGQWNEAAARNNRLSVLF